VLPTLNAVRAWIIDDVSFAAWQTNYSELPPVEWLHATGLSLSFAKHRKEAARKIRLGSATLRN
jgi:hypothetical protein